MKGFQVLAYFLLAKKGGENELLIISGILVVFVGVYVWDVSACL